MKMAKNTLPACQGKVSKKKNANLSPTLSDSTRYTPPNKTFVKTCSDNL